MDILIVTVFVSLVLVAGGVLFFVSRLREGDFEHGDRLSLLPLAEDANGEPRGRETRTGPASKQDSTGEETRVHS